MTRILLTLALALGSAAVAEERYALLIGANTGFPQDRALRHAESDARRVAEVLTELGQFPADHVIVLESPSTALVREKLRALDAQLRAAAGQTLLVVYYSGHADAQQLHLAGEPLTFEALNQALKDAPATVKVGIIDACRSGVIATAKGGAPVAPFEVKVVDDLSVHGLAVLTSSGADELSQEQRALQGSVFTHHLLSALRGAGDLDQNGQVTLAEAYRHAYQRTEADTAATLIPQRPAFRFDLKGAGELVVTWPARATAALLLPQGAGDRYVVVDEREVQVIAEALSSADHPVKVALPAGRYRVKQVLADHLAVAPLALEDDQQVSTTALAFSAQPLSGGVVKGGNPVTPTPVPGDSRGRTDGDEGSEYGHGGYVAVERRRFSLGLDFGAELAHAAPLTGTGGSPLYAGLTVSGWVSDWFLLDLHGDFGAATSRVNVLVGPRFRTIWWPVSGSLGLRAGVMVDTHGVLRFGLSPVAALDMLFLDRRLLLGLQASLDVPLGSPAMPLATRIGLNVGWRF